MQSKKTPAGAVTLGGMLAALAMVFMCMGTLIPLATYICPILCSMLLKVVASLCGNRMGWAWFGAVAILSLLFAPDKEAAAVFLTLGHYPLVKPWMDKRAFPLLWKALFFNGTMLGLYWVLMHILGLEQVVRDFEGVGFFFIALLLFMGNITFFLLDFLLAMPPRRRR